MEATRIAVAPGRMVADSVVLTAEVRSVLLPAASSARKRTTVLPCWEIATVPLTDGPTVIAASCHVAPLSVEYCSFVTAVSSVADSLTVTGPRYHGLRMPVGFAGSSVAAVIVGAVVSAVCASGRRGRHTSGDHGHDHGGAPPGQ